MEKENLINEKKNKKVVSIITSIIFIVFLIIFFTTDLYHMVLYSKEYKLYQYAIEYVEEELTYPSTAEFPSFSDVNIKKSIYSTQIIIEGGIYEDFEYAWDISGDGNSENSFGMKMNFRFTVTIVLLESGIYKCYKCDID